MKSEDARALLAKAEGQQPEAAILQQVRQYLRLFDWLVIRNQQGLGSHRGLSDLTCIKDGRVVFLEIKTEKGRLSEHQERFCKDVCEHGGEYRVARRLEDVEDMVGGAA